MNEMIGKQESLPMSKALLGITIAFIMTLAIMYLLGGSKRILSITSLVKPEVVVKEINQTPCDYFQEYCLYSPIYRRSRNKALSKYKFVFTGEYAGRFDDKKYLTPSVHGSDAVEISDMQNDGKSYIIVFSNKLPDPEFFKVKEMK
jgi:hypothetical protein